MEDMNRISQIVFLVAGCTALIFAGCTDTTVYPEDLIVISCSPAAGQTNISQNLPVQLRFSEPVDHRTVIGTNQIILVDQSNAPIPVSFTFVGEIVTVTPASPFAPSSTYGIAVRPGVQAMYGNNIAVPWAGCFSTGQTVGTILNFPPFFITPPVPPGPGGVPGSFAMTGSLNWARARHTLTTLIDNRIVAIGGENDRPLGRVLRSMEIFDPNTLRWSLSQSLGTGINGMNFERYGHTATRLFDGKLFVAGGTNNATVWDVAEIYDPLHDVFSVVNNTMVDRRTFHTAELMDNGNVLLIAGYNNWAGGVHFLDSMEVYDRNSGTFNHTSVTLAPFVIVNGPLPSQQFQTSAGRAHHISEVLQNQEVLIAGGYVDPWALQAPSTNDAQLYKPDLTGSGIQGTIARTGTPMTVPRVGHTSNIWYATEAAGLVVVFGGFENVPFLGVLQSGEVFDYSVAPSSGANQGIAGMFTPLAQQMTITRWAHTSTVVAGGLYNGGILITGGAFHIPPQDTNNALPNPRTYETLDYPGCIGCNVTYNSDIFMPFGFGKSLGDPYRGINVTGQLTALQDASGNTWTLAGPPPNYPGPYNIGLGGVFFHAAEGMSNGAVLICGGARCAGCIPVPYQWVIHANGSTGGFNTRVNTQGMSLIYNP